MSNRDQPDMHSIKEDCPSSTGDKRRGPVMISLESLNLSTIRMQSRLLPLNPTSKVLTLAPVHGEASVSTMPLAIDPNGPQSIILLHDIPESTRAYILSLRKHWLKRLSEAETWFNSRNEGAECMNNSRRNERILFIEGGIATLKFLCIRKLAEDIAGGDLRKAEIIFEKVESGWELMYKTEQQGKESEAEDTEIEVDMEEDSDSDSDSDLDLSQSDEEEEDEHPPPSRHDKATSVHEEDFFLSPLSRSRNSSLPVSRPTSIIIPQTRLLAPIFPSPAPIYPAPICSPIQGKVEYFTNTELTPPKVCRRASTGITINSSEKRIGEQSEKHISSGAQIAQAYALRLDRSFAPSSLTVGQSNNRRPTSLIILPPQASSPSNLCTVVESKPSLRDIKKGSSMRDIRGRSMADADSSSIQRVRSADPDRRSSQMFNPRPLSVADMKHIAGIKACKYTSTASATVDEAPFEAEDSSPATSIASSFASSDNNESFSAYTREDSVLEIDRSSSKTDLTDAGTCSKRSSNRWSYRHRALFPTYSTIFPGENIDTEGVIFLSEEIKGELEDDSSDGVLWNLFERLLAKEYGQEHLIKATWTEEPHTSFEEQEADEEYSDDNSPVGRICISKDYSVVGPEVEPQAPIYRGRKSIINCIQPAPIATTAWLQSENFDTLYESPRSLSRSSYISLTGTGVRVRKIDVIGDDDELKRTPLWVQNELRKFVKELVISDNEGDERGVGYKRLKVEGGCVHEDDDEKSVFEEDLGDDDAESSDSEMEEPRSVEDVWSDVLTTRISSGETLPTVDLIVAVGKEWGRRKKKKDGKGSRNSLVDSKNMTSNNNVIAERIISRIESMASRDRERLGLRKGACISVKYLLSLAASRNPEYNKNSALLHILPEIELLLAENKALRVLLLDFDLNSRSEVTAVLDLQRALASSYPTEGDIFRMICVVDEMPQEGITGTIVDSSLYILEQNSGTKPTLKPLKTPKGFENFKFPPVKPEAARKYTTDQRQLFELTNIVVESGDGFLRKDPHKKKTNRRAGQGNINDGLVARVTEIAEDWILSAQRRNGYTTFGHSPRPSHHQSIDNESVRIIPLQKPPARKSRPPSHSGFTIKPAEHYSSCPYQPRGLEVIVSLAEENASGGRNSYTQEYGKVKGLNIEPYCPSPSSQHTFLEDSDEEDARRNLLEEDDEDRIFTDDEYEEEGYCDSIEDYSIVVAKGYRPNSFHQRRSRCGKGHHSPEFSDNGDVTQYAWMSTDDHGRLKMKVMAAENGRYLGRAQGAGVGPRLRCAGTRLNPVINNIKAMKVLGLE